MRAGRADRSQYAPAYSVQLTDDAVQGSKCQTKHGAAPLRAEVVVQTRKTGNQMFYIVKMRHLLWRMLGC